jgi:hypothetical protein
MPYIVKHRAPWKQQHPWEEHRVRIIRILLLHRRHHRPCKALGIQDFPIRDWILDTMEANPKAYKESFEKWEK